MLQCRMCGPACDAAGRYGGCPRVWDLSGSPDSGYTTGRACASLERIDGSHHCSTGFFGGVCARVERQHRSVLPSAASPASSCMVTACCMPLNSPVSVVCCLREHSVPHIVQEPRHRPGAPCQGWCVTNPSIPPRLQPPTSCTPPPTQQPRSLVPRVQSASGDAGCSRGHSPRSLCIDLSSLPPTLRSSHDD